MSKSKQKVVEGKTLKQWLDQELKPQTVSLWGQPQVFTPVLISDKFGDGKQLVSLHNINQRPRYWLALVSSSWDFTTEERDMTEAQKRQRDKNECMIADAARYEFGSHQEYPYLYPDDFAAKRKELIESGDKEGCHGSEFDDVANFETHEEYAKNWDYPMICIESFWVSSVVNFGKSKADKV